MMALSADLYIKYVFFVILKQKYDVLGGFISLLA